MIPEPNFPAKPDEFVGRKPQLEAFRQALRQGIVTGRTPSFAVLGEWGIGKSSLLSKCSAICEEPEFEMLPVPFSVSNELGDYRRFAELLVDTLGGCLARAQSVQARIRGEAQNWNLKRVNVGPVALERETPKLFLTSGTAILRHAVQDAWRRFIRPAQLNGIVFFLDDLQNLNTPSQHAVALALRDQFQWFAIENINCSICFSASANYFSNIRSLAEPAVRFYDKVYLGPFSVHETVEYVKAIFETVTNCADFAQWLHSKTAGHPYFMAAANINDSRTPATNSVPQSTGMKSSAASERKSSLPISPRLRNAKCNFFARWHDGKNKKSIARSLPITHESTSPGSPTKDC